MAREDLNPIEEARACAALVEELGLTREEVGRRVGRSRVAVSNLMRLLDLPDDVDRAARGRARSARATAGRCCWPRTTAPAGVWRAQRSHEGWSVRVTEERARQSNAGRDAPKRSARGSHARRTPTSSRRRARSPRRSASALGAEVRVKATRERAIPRGALVLDTRGGDRAGARAAPARGDVGGARTAARIGARGRLAQLVRALL